MARWLDGKMARRHGSKVARRQDQQLLIECKMNGCLRIWHRELLLTINQMGEKLNLLIRYYRSSTVVVSTARHHCYDPWVRVGLGDHRAGLSQTCQTKINPNINKYSI